MQKRQKRYFILLHKFFQRAYLKRGGRGFIELKFFPDDFYEYFFLYPKLNLDGSLCFTFSYTLKKKRNEGCCNILNLGIELIFIYDEFDEFDEFEKIFYFIYWGEFLTEL